VFATKQPEQVVQAPVQPDEVELQGHPSVRVHVPEKVQVQLIVPAGQVAAAD
jgi:hypothetical protein